MGFKSTLSNVVGTTVKATTVAVKAVNNTTIRPVVTAVDNSLSRHEYNKQNRAVATKLGAQSRAEARMAKAQADLAKVKTNAIEVAK